MAKPEARHDNAHAIETKYESWNSRYGDGICGQTQSSKLIDGRAFVLNEAFIYGLLHSVYAGPGLRLSLGESR